MPFAVFTDGCSNLPGKTVRSMNVNLLPCSYTANGKPGTYTGDLDTFDSHTYYDQLRAGFTIKTSLLNTHLFITHFTPALERGEDVVYVGLSPGFGAGRGCGICGPFQRRQRHASGRPHGRR